MSALPDVRFRPMTASDIPAGLQLCRASRWNQLAADWERFLTLDPRGAVVAVRDEVVVGSVATIRYPPDVAWVAMVLVDPAERGRGVGTALLRQGLALLEDVPRVGLDATPAGQPLYQKLGFTNAFALQRMERAATSSPAWPGDCSASRRLRADDWPALLALDEAVTGLQRRPILEWLAATAPHLAWVHETAPAGPIDGFVLGRPGFRYEHVGPIVATNQEAARALLQMAVNAAPSERPVIVDAVGAQSEWVEWLETIGFTLQRPFTRMYRGAASPFSSAPGLFAVIGPEFG